MPWGRPTVVIPCPVGRIHIHEQTGLVSAAETPQSLADSIQRLHQHPDDYRRFRQKAWGTRANLSLEPSAAPASDGSKPRAAESGLSVPMTWTAFSIELTFVAIAYENSKPKNQHAQSSCPDQEPNPTTGSRAVAPLSGPPRKRVQKASEHGRQSFLPEGIRISDTRLMNPTTDDV